MSHSNLAEAAEKPWQDQLAEAIAASASAREALVSERRAAQGREKRLASLLQAMKLANASLLTERDALRAQAAVARDRCATAELAAIDGATPAAVREAPQN